MANHEAFELQKRRSQMDQDAEKLVDKYLKIFEWEIPESNEARAYEEIINELRQALNRLESKVLDGPVA
jgi:guanylate kinase